MHGKQRMAALVLALISTLAGLACSSAATKAGATQACFDGSRIRSFSPLDPRFVYVRVGSDEHYLLTLDTFYSSLPYAVGVSISGTFSRVCSDTGARLTYLEAGHPVFCRIIGVEGVASKKAAQKLVEQRTGPKQKG